MGNKGFEAALAAVEMANLKKAISKNVVGRASAVARKNNTVVRKNKNSARAKRNR
jgi:hypothetical protein